MPSPESQSSVVVNRTNQPVEVHLAGLEVVQIDPFESVTVTLGEDDHPHVAELERLQIVEVLSADEVEEADARAGRDADEATKGQRGRRASGRSRREAEKGEGAKG